MGRLADWIRDLIGPAPSPGGLCIVDDDPPVVTAASDDPPADF